MRHVRRAEADDEALQLAMEVIGNFASLEEDPEALESADAPDSVSSPTVVPEVCRR